MKRTTHRRRVIDPRARRKQNAARGKRRPVLPDDAPRIVRLVSIVDTRDREERDGMYSSYSVPVAGTGIANVCMRCGSLHEVHATVELSDGTHAVVGTGCARQEAMDAGDKALARAIDSAERRAKMRPSLVADIAHLGRMVDAQRAAHAKVTAMAPPPVVWRHSTQATDEDRAALGFNPTSRQSWFVACGDARRWTFAFPPGVDNGRGSPSDSRGMIEDRARYADFERRGAEDQARMAWRQLRMEEFGAGTSEHQGAFLRLEEAQRKLRKLDAKG